jgi:predicted  nucleic acid-binding Zn-ribbon protein
MNVAKQLYELQEVDLALEAQELALKQLVSQLGESQAVLSTRSKLAAEEQRLEELGRKQHSLEWEIDDITTKITKAEEELYSGRVGNPKELANLQHEIKVLKAKRSQLEDRTIEVMEQVEGAKAGVDSLKSELKALEIEWQAQQGKLKAEKEHLETERVSLKQKREVVVAQVDSEAVDFYVGLKGQKGTAVARVEQGVCRGCRISLSNAEIQRARGGDLVQCSSCGRILFLL